MSPKPPAPRIEFRLRERAASGPMPPDIAHVCNSRDLRHPQVLILPTGSARAVAADGGARRS